jgi:hypothetical protein
VDPVQGPLYSTIGDKRTNARMVQELNSQGDIVEVRTQSGVLLTMQINTKLRSLPRPYQPVSRERASRYYANNPIEDHTPSLPPVVTSIIAVTGEPLSTSTKEVADTEEILVKDLLWPKRHVGKCTVDFEEN